MGELWQYITPDTKGKGRPKEKDSTAIRAKWFHENQNNNRNKAADASKSSKWTLKSAILLAPWSSILSWAFQITGIILYVMNADKASRRTKDILTITNSDENGYTRHLNTMLNSYIISNILLVVCILVGAIASWIHIKHVLRGSLWGPFRRFTLVSILSVGVLYLTACLVWFLILMNYLTSWAMALWNLEDASFATASVLQSRDVDSSDVCLPACLDLRRFPFLASASCTCSPKDVETIGSMASDTKGKVIWLLVGVTCAMTGILLSIINVAADIGGVNVPMSQQIVACDCKTAEDVEEGESFQPSCMPSITPRKKASKISV
ncbi:hypothetical protein M9435_005499 [Picochlorum sp. BPE23]|nr:hypothetical protein M9435_005499 [Picochlorum sp. BPE23]